MDAADSEQAVFLIIGHVTAEEDGPEIAVHIMLKAADDDSAIREALNSLAEEGYVEASFDQIGTIVDAPIEEPHASAFQGALEGEVAIVTYDSELSDGATDPLPRRDGRFIDDDDDDYDPFAALKDWKPGGS